MLAAVFHNTVSVDQCCNLTPVTSVTTFKNWWQLGFHPKFAIDTLSFYSEAYRGRRKSASDRFITGSPISVGSLVTV